jgi:hypothetical protein
MPGLGSIVIGGELECRLALLCTEQFCLFTSFLTWLHITFELGEVRYHGELSALPPHIFVLNPAVKQEHCLLCWTENGRSAPHSVLQENWRTASFLQRARVRDRVEDWFTPSETTSENSWVS